MATLLERGLSMAARALPATAGGLVLYGRGDSVVGVRATFGRTEFNVEDSDGVRIELSDRDFIVEADRLILNGARVTPARGDKVTVIHEDHLDNEVFEVLAPSGMQPYRLCDPHGVLIRIHGKRIT